MSKLLQQKHFQKPAEVEAMAAWCQREYPAFNVAVQKRTRDYLLTVPNAPLAQDIQMRLLELKTHAGIETATRITIRIA